MAHVNFVIPEPIVAALKAAGFEQLHPKAQTSWNSDYWATATPEGERSLHDCRELISISDGGYYFIFVPRSGGDSYSGSPFMLSPEEMLELPAIIVTGRLVGWEAYAKDR